MVLKVIEGTAGGLQKSIDGSATKFAGYLKQVEGSSTAQSIKSYLDGAKETVGVLLIDEGFDSMYIPPCALAGDASLSAYNGGVAVMNVTSTLSIGGTVLPLGVSLMHELGHAKQFIEKPVWFEEQFKAATQKGSKQAQLAIENENVTRHEKPICTDLGKPSRDKYD